MPSGDNYMDFHLDYPQSQGAMIMTPTTVYNYIPGPEVRRLQGRKRRKR